MSKTAGVSQPYYFLVFYRHGAAPLPRHGKTYELPMACIRTQAIFKTAAIHTMQIERARSTALQSRQC